MRQRRVQHQRQRIHFSSCNTEHWLSTVPTRPNTDIDGNLVAQGNCSQSSPALIHIVPSTPAFPSAFECSSACRWMRLSNNTTFHSQYTAYFLYNKMHVCKYTAYYLHNKTCLNTPNWEGWTLRLIQEDMFVFL